MSKRCPKTAFIPILKNAKRKSSRFTSKEIRELSAKVAENVNTHLFPQSIFSFKPIEPYFKSLKIPSKTTATTKEARHRHANLLRSKTLSQRKDVSDEEYCQTLLPKYQGAGRRQTELSRDLFVFRLWRELKSTNIQNCDEILIQILSPIIPAVTMTQDAMRSMRGDYRRRIRKGQIKATRMMLSHLRYCLLMPESS